MLGSLVEPGHVAASFAVFALAVSSLAVHAWPAPAVVLLAQLQVAAPNQDPSNDSGIYAARLVALV